MLLLWIPNSWQVWLYNASAPEDPNGTIRFVMLFLSFHASLRRQSQRKPSQNKDVESSEDGSKQTIDYIML